MAVNELLERLEAVERRVAAACERAERPRHEVTLVPVSKTRPLAEVLAVVDAGYPLVAENRVQELAQKAAGPGAERVRWALIGHLQTNKAKDVVGLVSQFQALDSVKVARALHTRLESEGHQLDVLVQVNTSGEASKTGVRPNDAEALARELAAFDSLRPVGLMTIATLTDDRAEVARCFRELAELGERLRQQQVAGSDWRELSMGMSGDLESAIQHGSTMVRVGRAIFGERPRPTA